MFPFILLLSFLFQGSSLPASSSHLPSGKGWNVDRVRAHIRQDADLESYVGLGPESVLEGALEPYLRIKLLLGKLDLDGYSAHWVAHLPPPSEFGRAQAEYDHFSHQLAWLKRAPHGLKVAENGLVSFESENDPELQAAE